MFDCPSKIHFSSSLEEKNSFWDSLSLLRSNDIFLLMEEKTKNLFYPSLKKHLPNSPHYVLPSAQEDLKSFFYYEKVIQSMLTQSISRKGCLIAIGGGSLLDLAGFVASTYARGIKLAFIPTTFLSMVDACLGGKTALNVLHTKNVIGTFYPASDILIALDTLSSLPFEQLQSGLAEVIKYSLIASPALFIKLSQNKDLFFRRDLSFLQELIEISLHIKQTIVMQDPKEKGLRRSLNFGHTLGHALEGFCQYTLLHGFAVAIGMVLESHLSSQLSLFSKEELYRVFHLCKEYGLLQKLPSFSYEDLLPFLQKDKKNADGHIRCTLLSHIGTVDPLQGSYCTNLSTLEIKNCLHWYWNEDSSCYTKPRTR